MLETKRASHRHRQGHAAIFERQGRVRAETVVRLSLVLDFEEAAETIGERMGIRQGGSTAFAERDDVWAIVGIGDVQGQKRPESPKIAPILVPAGIMSAFGANSVEIEDDLDRPAVAFAEIHHPVLGIIRAANRAGKVRYITHRGPLRLNSTVFLVTIQSYPSGESSAKRAVPLVDWEGAAVENPLVFQIVVAASEYAPGERRP